MAGIVVVGFTCRCWCVPGRVIWVRDRLDIVQILLNFTSLLYVLRCRCRLRPCAFDNANREVIGGRDVVTILANKLPCWEDVPDFARLIFCDQGLDRVVAGGVDEGVRDDNFEQRVGPILLENEVRDDVFALIIKLRS